MRHNLAPLATMPFVENQVTLRTVVFERFDRVQENMSRFRAVLVPAQRTNDHACTTKHLAKGHNLHFS